MRRMGIPFLSTRSNFFVSVFPHPTPEQNHSEKSLLLVSHKGVLFIVTSPLVFQTLFNFLGLRSSLVKYRMANSSIEGRQGYDFDTLDYIQLTIYPLILLFGAIGNILVILVVQSKKKSRKINDCFILNLAVSDLCMLTISITADFYLKFQAFPLGNLLCKGIWPLMTMCLFASIFTLTCMAIERWRTIVKPFRRRLAVLKVVWINGFTWLAGFFCVLPLVAVAYHEGRWCREAWPTPAMRQAYTVAVVVLQYALPLLIITIAYARIGAFLKQRTKILTDDFDISRPAATRLRRSAENAKINKNLRTIVMLFALFMLPKQILWLWLDFGRGGDFEHFSDTLIFSEFLLYIHSSTNPVVYGTILREYRSGFCQYIRRFCPFIFRCCVYGGSVHPSPTHGQQSVSQGNVMVLGDIRKRLSR